MKKIFAFLLAVLLLASVCALTACDNTQEGTSTADSSVAGEWRVTSTDDEVLWFMNSQDTLHITEVSDGNRYTTVCSYSYDETTGAFEYTCLSASGSFKGTAKVGESYIRLEGEDGRVISLTKVS